MHSSFKFSPVTFGLLVVFLPLVTTHLCFMLSVYQGSFDGCNPYWTDCTSISKARDPIREASRAMAQVVFG